MFRQRTAALGVFADRHPECFTAGERAELIALTRLINAEKITPSYGADDLATDAAKPYTRMGRVALDGPRADDGLAGEAAV